MRVALQRDVAALDEALQRERAGADRAGEERGRALPAEILGHDRVGEDRDVRQERRPRLGQGGHHGAGAGRPRGGRSAGRAPSALSEEIAKSRKLSGPLASPPARRMENTTSSAVTGLPSENFTPGRNAKVQVLPSVLTVWPWASQGSSWPAGLVM